MSCFDRTKTITIHSCYWNIITNILPLYRSKAKAVAKFGLYLHWTIVEINWIGTFYEIIDEVLIDFALFCCNFFMPYSLQRPTSFFLDGSVQWTPHNYFIERLSHDWERNQKAHHSFFFTSTLYFTILTSAASIFSLMCNGCEAWSSAA